MVETESIELESYDELPFWSAPFGLTLLDTIRLRKGMKVLDIGSGNGFPMLEIADRLGVPGHVTGLDPMVDALRIISAKIIRKEVRNATIIKGVAEEMPFDNDQFDLITSNNGLNNVSDQPIAFRECYRVAKTGAQMVITMNLPHTMIEFYEILEQVLIEKKMIREMNLMKDHISLKRRPVGFLKNLLITTGFSIQSINIDGFKYRFASAEALFRHNLIKNYFLPSWIKILPEGSIEQIIILINERIDACCDEDGEFTLSIPYVCFDCQKPLTSDF